MAKIYLINVGANTGDRRKARSPIFSDGTWIYVPFPPKKEGQEFPKQARPFVRNNVKCHLDPDWNGLTYGDCCRNRRARALLKTREGDILLFWALLWKTQRNECIFKSHDKGWYLIGALRVECIFKDGDKVTCRRARRNAHVRGGHVERRRGDGVRVFAGSRQYSCRFVVAVDWEVRRNGGLMQQVVRTKDGQEVQWNRSPRWNSVTRSCRAILDLDKPDDRKAAKILARHIRRLNKGFDLLKAAGDN